MGSVPLRTATHGDRPPGVQVEWLARPRPSGIRRTDIAGFVGYTSKGPTDHAVRVESWRAFVEAFGEARAGAGEKLILPASVRGFFANGGVTCYIVRVVPKTSASASGQFIFRGRHYNVSASSPGSWANTAELRLRLGPFRHVHLVVEIGDVIIAEQSLALSEERPVQDEVETLLDVVPALTIAPDPEPQSETTLELEEGVELHVPLDGGIDGLNLASPDDLTGKSGPSELTDQLERRRGLALLETVEPVSIVAMPDMVRFEKRDHAALQVALVDHCERLRTRFALLDPPLKLRDPSPLIDEQAADEQWLIPPRSAFAAFYFPSLLAPIGGDRARVDLVPPSGHIAGTYARVDRAFGAHAAPANQRLFEVHDVHFDADDGIHALLNSVGINVIRSDTGRGVRAMGARTRSIDTSWRYINVRRLISLIIASLESDTQWAVFETNDQRLWQSLERAAGGLLNRLWRRGMLAGATPDEAYFVRCDETTNPPENLTFGRVVCLLGVQPPPPAEFITLRIGLSDSGAEELQRGGENFG